MLWGLIGHCKDLRFHSSEMGTIGGFGAVIWLLPSWRQGTENAGVTLIRCSKLSIV